MHKYSQHRDEMHYSYEYSRCPSLTPYHVSALSALKADLLKQKQHSQRAPYTYVQALETANTLSLDHKQIVKAF